MWAIFKGMIQNLGPDRKGFSEAFIKARGAELPLLHDEAVAAKRFYSRTEKK